MYFTCSFRDLQPYIIESSVNQPSSPYSTINQRQRRHPCILYARFQWKGTTVFSDAFSLPPGSREVLNHLDMIQSLLNNNDGGRRRHLGTPSSIRASFGFNSCRFTPNTHYKDAISSQSGQINGASASPSVSPRSVKPQQDRWPSHRRTTIPIGSFVLKTRLWESTCRAAQEPSKWQNDKDVFNLRLFLVAIFFFA